MYIQPGQNSIPWKDFQHFVDAISFIMWLGMEDALKLALQELKEAHIGIHCALSDIGKTTDSMTEETLEAIRQLGGL